MMRRSRARALVALLVGLAAAATLSQAGAVASAPPARPSLPVIERQVMCVTCKIPLNVAQSPQADRERAYIQGLIDKGYSEPQIKRALVDQYGPTVLGLPGSHGFDLSAYLVPLAVVLALLATLGVLLPRWRRRARGGPGAGATPPKLDASDAARLESDLARFD
jgi:cytochrome c-type biogenesis protein CcmH